MRPLPQAPPDIRLWEKAKIFFDSIPGVDGQECIINICRPPANATRDTVVNQFEQLRLFANPGDKDNIQLDRHGTNHYCILGENGRGLLSVTLDNSGSYRVEYEGRRIKHAFSQS